MRLLVELALPKIDKTAILCYTFFEVGNHKISKKRPLKCGQKEDKTMKSSLILTAVLTAVTAFGQAQVRPANRVIRFEDARAANTSERARFENAARATAVPQQAQLTSHFAMVQVAGTVGDDVALGIWGIIHTAIPAGSLVGLRVRHFDGTTQIEGVGTWDYDLQPGNGFIVKSPGGGLMFSSTKQYEVIVVDANKLVTTTDFISVVTGNGPFIQSPQIVFAQGNTYLQIATQGGGQVNAVVINGIVVPAGIFTTVGNNVIVNLTQFGLCFGGGDISVTVTRDGQSDTTQFRFSQGVQSCGEPKG